MSAEFLFKHRISRILRIFFIYHLMKPDEPDGWRKKYCLVHLVCLVIIISAINVICCFLNDCAAAEVEFRRERYAVHFLFGFVLECDFLFCYDSAG